MASSLSPTIEEEADESNIPGDSRESSNEITCSYGNENIFATMTADPILESSAVHGEQAQDTRAAQNIEEGWSKSAEKMKTLKKVLKETIEGSISSEDLRLLVVGKTGEGKSSLVNSIIEMGEEVAKEGARADCCTYTVQLYPYSDVIPGVNVTLVDSPGLQDTQEKEQSYIEAIKSTCQEVSLVLYCMKMTNHRLTNDDKLAMQKFHQAFGPKFWERVVFVLTHANDENCEQRDDRDEGEQEPPLDDGAAWNELIRRRFINRVEICSKQVKEFLKKNVSDKIEVDKIQFIAAGTYKVTRSCRTPLRLHGHDNWLYNLLKSCCRQVKNVHRFEKLSLNDRIHVAVIINNDGAVDENGQIITSDHVTKLKDTFKKLGFFFLCFNGLSSESIACLLESLQYVDHSELASFALVILSKGETHHVYDVNNERISFEVLIGHFLRIEENLIKIPKLFFFHLSHQEKPKDELVFDDVKLKLPENSIALAVSVKHPSGNRLSPAIKAFSNNVKCSNSMKNCFTKIHSTCASSVPIDKLSDDFLFPTPYEPPTDRKKKYFLKKQLILYRIMWHHVRCKTVNVLLSNMEEVLAIVRAERRAEILTSSAGVVIGGGLVVAGIAAAPFTLGASIGLAVAGGVVGAAAGAGNITAKVTAEVMANRKLKKAQQSISFDQELSLSLNKVVANYNELVNRCARDTTLECVRDNPGNTQSATIDRAKSFAGILVEGALAVTLPLDIGVIAYNSYLVYQSEDKSGKSDKDRVVKWFVKQTEEMLKGTFDTLNVTKYEIADQRVTSDGHKITDDVFGCILLVQINMTSKLTVRTIISGPFILPKGTTLVSAVYDVLMEAPVAYTIEIQHCVDITDQSTAEKMTFATATVDFDKKAFVFTPLKGGIFPQGQTHGSISLRDSSLLCILYYSESLQDQLMIKYAAQCSTTSECRNFWRKDITFTKCLNVHHKYIQMDAAPAIVTSHPFKFTRPSAGLPCIELETLKRSNSIRGWLISPDSTKFIPDTICKQGLDTAELQDFFKKPHNSETFSSLTLDIQVEDEENAGALQAIIEVTGTDLKLDISLRKD